MISVSPAPPTHRWITLCSLHYNTVDDWSDQWLRIPFVLEAGVDLLISSDRMGASPCGSNYSREPVTSLTRLEMICELNSILWVSRLRIIVFKLIFFWINVMPPNHHGHSKTLNKYWVLPVLRFFSPYFFFRRGIHCHVNRPVFEKY